MNSWAPLFVAIDLACHAVAAACAPPSIVTQPASQTVLVGSSVTLTVAASGTPPLSYLWFKNGTLVGGGTASYTTPVAKATDKGTFNYYCIVADSCGQIQSNSAVLTISCAPLAITVQPLSQTTKGLSPTFDTIVQIRFSIAATGTEPLSYQWQVSSGSGVSWANASSDLDTTCCAEGMTTPTYTTPEISAKHDGRLFRCIVKDACGDLDTSEAARLTVTKDSCIWATSQPKDQCVNLGESATFTIAAAGASPRSLLWYKDYFYSSGGGDTAIPGATLSSYTTPPAISSDDRASFYCLVSGPCGLPVQIWGGSVYIVPSTPITPFPSDGATSQAENLTLTWTAPGAMVCSLEVSTAADFSSGNSVTRVDGTSEALSFSGNTRFYWRVKACESHCWTGYSSTWVFTTGLWPPAAPALLLPTPGEMDVNTSPTLTWGAVQDAATYHVDVSTNVDFSTLYLDDSSLTVDSIKLSGLALDSDYYWRVSASNPAGTSAWSIVSRFTVAPTATGKVPPASRRELEAYFNPRSSTHDLIVSVPDHILPGTDVRLTALGGKLVGHWRIWGSGVHRISIGTRRLVPGIYVCRIKNGSTSVIRKLPAFVSP